MIDFRCAPAVCLLAAGLASAQPQPPGSALSHGQSAGPAAQTSPPAGSREGEARAASSDLRAQALFEAMLITYAKDHDFRVRFTETPFSRAAGDGPAESGIVVFKRPGFWRWEYRSPEPKIVILRDGVATLKIEGDSEVSHYRLAGEAGTAGETNGVGALLAGGQELSRRFVASFEPRGREGEPVLRLDPVSLSDEFDHIVVRLGVDDLRIRELIVEDPGGNRLRFDFDRFEPNFGASDELFKIPADDPGRGPGRTP